MKQTIYLIAVCLMFPAFALAAGAGEPDAAGLQAIQGGSRSVTYKGRVVDERSSVPLAGVAIVVKDAPQIGMTTNSEGEFRITIPVRYQPLVSVSYIGYQPRESVLVAAAENEIRLKEEAQALEEVQVIAYGQQKKVSVTGAIASINTKDLLKSPSGSAGSALAGAVTGISSVQISGQPGAEDPDIYVRGTGSLSNEASKAAYPGGRCRAFVFPDGLARDRECDRPQGCIVDGRIRGSRRQWCHPGHDAARYEGQATDFMELDLRTDSVAATPDLCRQLYLRYALFRGPALRQSRH